MARIISSLAEISDRFDAVFCDVWGVVHDGVCPNIEANNALRRLSRRGKPVILLTNSPRPASHVEQQIRQIGVPDDAWSLIVTSGDAARDALFGGAVGTRVYHLGPESALTFFNPASRPHRAQTEIRRVDFDAADGIVCTGLVDDTRETPDDYRKLLTTGVDRNLTLLCANPDIVVDRGPNRVFCAGAIAALYEQLGGRVLVFGKPRAKIYDLARRQFAQLRPDCGDARILCIGDGIHTDVKGARNQSLDCLFVSGGLCAEETGTVIRPDPELLEEFLAAAGANPEYAIGFLC